MIEFLINTQLGKSSQRLIVDGFKLHGSAKHQRLHKPETSLGHGTVVFATCDAVAHPIFQQTGVADAERKRKKILVFLELFQDTRLALEQRRESLDKLLELPVRE